MQNNVLLADYDSNLSEYHIYHDPMDKVYQIFVNPNSVEMMYQGKVKVSSMKRDTTLDDEGNEITVIILDKYQFTFLVENTLKTQTNIFFILRCIYYPSKFSPFSFSVNFFWDTITEVTVLNINVYFENRQYTPIVRPLLNMKTVYPFKELEKYLKKTIKNLEETESITINSDVDKVWCFVSALENLKYFFPMKSIDIQPQDEKRIKIVDLSSKLEIMLIRTEVFKKGRDVRNLKLELIDSNAPMPKQLIEIHAIQVSSYTLVMFKHTILDYIPYDALKSNSKEKQKILKRIKKKLEDKKNQDEKGKISSEVV